MEVTAPAGHTTFKLTTMKRAIINELISQGRKTTSAREGDEQLGHLKLLPGTWKNLPNLPGRGWNMIALPFKSDNPNLNYRLLVNQYNETLRFSTVDKGVPNRGIEKEGGEIINSDQFVVTLDYEQTVQQIAADDFPQSGKLGNIPGDIHHEPGLFLQMLNHFSEDLEVARLGSVPHGNALLALGKVHTNLGAPIIPDDSGLPIGVSTDLNRPYMAPYKHYNDHPFMGIFDPVTPNDLLKEANRGVDIVRTTEFEFNTNFGTGGINNIPFIKRQADASEMHSRFWIQELAETDTNGNPKLRLQYTQTVMLDFFARPNGEPGLIKWPHVSINTLEKVD